MRSFILASVFVFLSLSLALPSFASAQGITDQMGFTVSPVPVSDPAVTASGFFIYKMQSSASMTGSVLLKNPSTKPLTIQLAAVDALTAQMGGSAFSTADVTPSGAGTWLKFAESNVTLPAGMQKPVDFTVSVPQGLRPGQYLTGISAYIPSLDTTAVGTPGSTSMGAGVTMQTRYVIGVEVDIAGAWTPSLTIDNVDLIQQPSGPFVGVHLNNAGDTFLKPAGTIVMTDTAGRRVLEQPIQMGTFIPGTQVVYPVKWSGVLAAGRYNVHVQLNYDVNRVAVYDSKLEVSVEKVVQDTTGAIQAPGSIGSDNNTENSTSLQLPATPQRQGELTIWFWIASGLGFILLAIAVLLILKRTKARKLQAQMNELSNA